MCIVYVCIHTHNAILLSHNKNEIMLFAAIWMDLEIIILNEVSQTKTNIIWNRLYVESKIWQKWTYLPNRNRLIDIENRLVVAKGEGGGRGMDWEFEVGRCKLLHLEWINNKVLIYSTGNYIQYPVINHNGKEYKKECVYVYNWVTLLYSRDWYNIVKQLFFNIKKESWPLGTLWNFLKTLLRYISHNSYELWIMNSYSQNSPI